MKKPQNKILLSRAVERNLKAIYSASPYNYGEIIVRLQDLANGPSPNDVFVKSGRTMEGSFDLYYGIFGQTYQIAYAVGPGKVVRVLLIKLLPTKQ